MQVFMAKYRIAWVPGDGIGMEALEVASASQLSVTNLAKTTI
jgi:isocitrate/isopropylmalate dehydrogenase